MNNNQDATFYQIQEDFYNYWSGKTPERGKGYKPFKRWEDYMAPRVYPTGDITLPTTTYDNYMTWLLRRSNNSERSFSSTSSLVTSNWTQLGPIGPADGPLPYTGTGAGRVNFLRFDPNNSNIMYVGAPDGGLWKSTDGGETWQLVADGKSPNYKSCVQYIPGTNGKEVIAVGKTGVSFSNDGGKNWKDISTDGYYSIQFVDSNTAWLSGHQKIGKLTLK